MGGRDGGGNLCEGTKKELRNREERLAEGESAGNI